LNIATGEVQYDKSGFIGSEGRRVWYGIVGSLHETGRVPLLTVHGGPGLNHRTLDALSVVADTGRAVVFYDQLGCGESDHPTDGMRWTRSHFVEELGHVRATLGLDRVHLLAHSYGGPLCLDYLLSQGTEGIVSVTLSDSFASVPGLVKGWQAIRSSFPPEVLATLERHEAAGTVGDPEYVQLLGQHFISQHVMMVPMSERMAAAVNDLNPEIYAALHGRSWFETDGEYGDFDVTDRLAEIDVPTLVIAGRNDQCVPALSEAIHAGVPGSELVIVEGASHLPFLERPDEYFSVLNRFLAGADQTGAVGNDREA